MLPCLPSSPVECNGERALVLGYGPSTGLLVKVNTTPAKSLSLSLHCAHVVLRQGIFGTNRECSRYHDGDWGKGGGVLYRYRRK
jgi:hypothetical protein